MLFNSVEYLFFLPIVFLLYWFVFKHLRIQNLFIVVASYLFYGWWDYRFLFLIAITSLLSYLSGVGIKNFEEGLSNSRLRKILTGGNIVINLTILAVFKYYNFFVDTFVQFLGCFGIHANISSLQLILPVGISFYTFQALSYTIDVYRKKIEPTHDLCAFFAYISFFPQLVAGPIERSTNLLPQFYVKRKFDYEKAVDGMRQILWGLFKKMVIADNCASIVNHVFDDYSRYNSISLIAGAFFFTIQIYGDFSGYSDIAIGTAKLFGIKLKRNFNVPYFSRDVAEFWRRWHISLNTWFVDYLYIPNGGSRRGRITTIRNIFTIFLVSGLWHGANWTFVLWGLYHAFCFVPLLIANRTKRFKNNVAEGRMLPNVREMVMMLTTFIIVMIGWIIFRSDSIADAWGYICGTFCSGGIMVFVGKKDIFFVIFMFIFEWINREKPHPMAFDKSGIMKYRAVRLLFYYVLAITTLTMSGAQSDFIYFQF